MIAPLWLKATWEWLKKYWKWLLFPIGILVYIVGRSSAKTNISVVSPELMGHADVDKTLASEAEHKKQVVDEAAAAQLSGIEAKRSAEVSSETQKQIDEVKSVQGDPQAVNDLLKNIGKDIRGAK